MSELAVIHRSNSQLSTYQKCGEQYRLQKVEHAPQTPAAWLHSGTAFHQAIEMWEKSDREMPEYDARQVYLTAFDDGIRAEQERWPDLEVWGKAGRYKPQEYIDSLRVKGPDWVSAYIAYATANEGVWGIHRLPDGSPAVEVPFYLELGSVYVRGFIDQVLEYYDGTLVVRDLKSGAKPPKDLNQLGLYGLAFEDMFDLRPQYGDYYMAKDGKPTVSEPLERYTREYLTGVYEDLDRGIRQEVFLPKPEPDNCRPCGVQRFCYIGGGTDLTYARKRAAS